MIDTRVLWIAFAASASSCGRVLDVPPGGSDVPNTGAFVAELGDLDGDGCTELAVTSWFHPVTGATDVVVWIISGRTGEARFGIPISAADSGHYGSVSGVGLFRSGTNIVVAIGDLDADGKSELSLQLPMAPGPVTKSGEPSEQEGHIVMLAGSDGHVLRCVHGAAALDEFGTRVVRLDDVDADGVHDLVIVASGNPSSEDATKPRPRIVVVSGKSGTTFYTQAGPFPREPSPWFGRGLALTGDIDGDGIRDFVAGDDSAALSRGSVVALSARTGALLWNTEGARAFGDFGGQLATIEDVDTDGCTDLLAPCLNGPPRVLSGRTGKSLATTLALQTARTIQDADGDARMDFAGFETSARREAVLISGASNRVLHRLPIAADYATISDAASAGDVDGDGRGDVFVVSDRPLTWRGGRFIADWASIAIHSGRDGSVLHHFDREWLARTYAARPPMHAPVCEHAKR